MISVIVCSINDKVFAEFSQNISDTIGTAYEIIRIDNSGNTDSICSAYNKGAKRAVYEIVCFVHEDVFFHTNDWGKTVSKIFAEPDAPGLLGIAGSRYKSFAPASWGLIPAERFINIIQQHKYRTLEAFHHFENPTGQSLADVVCIDGVWMCTTRSIALEIGFDDITLQGFHGYDIDFSLAIYKKYRVAVTFDVLLAHFSEGRNDRSWVIEMMKLHKKWKKELPLSNMSGKNIGLNVYEGSAVHHFLELMMSLKFPAKEIFSMLEYNNQNPNLNRNFLISLKFRALKYFFVHSWPGRFLAKSRSISAQA
ncbi:MAG: glycosyltransferase [Chitinophagaceae bacterium]